MITSRLACNWSKYKFKGRKNNHIFTGARISLILISISVLLRIGKGHFEHLSKYLQHKIANSGI